MADRDELRARLEAVAEELADLAIDVLRQAVAGDADPAEERRLTRARRAVERAVHLLGDGGGDEEI